MSEVHQVSFELGDWSRDGHNQSSKYIIHSNKPVDHLRETHFAADELLGFKIGEICGEYEMNRLEDSQGARLVELDIIGEDDYKYEGEYDGMDEDDVLKLWLKILKHVDPELDLRIMKEAQLPSMHFYGFDDKQRHLDTPGYGLFYG